MGELEVLGIMCGVAAAFGLVLVPFVVWLVRSLQRAQRAVDEALAAYGRTRGMPFTSRPPRISGSFEGALVSIGLRTDGPHGASRPVTVVRTPRTGSSAPDAAALHAEAARLPGFVRVTGGPEVAIVLSGYVTDPATLDETCRLAVQLAR